MSIDDQAAFIMFSIVVSLTFAIGIGIITKNEGFGLLAFSAISIIALAVFFWLKWLFHQKESDK